ncbi:hypothetical protein D3C76_1666990 [compost metagenome]
MRLIDFADFVKLAVRLGPYFAELGIFLQQLLVFRRIFQIIVQRHQLLLLVQGIPEPRVVIVDNIRRTARSEQHIQLLD